MRIVFLLSVLCLISACKSTKEVIFSDEEIKQVKVTPEDLLFMLQKGACFGTCPEYTFKVYKNRFAQYVGKRNTGRIGTYAKFISKDKFEVLTQVFEKEDFMSYLDSYESNIPDLPLIKIAQRKNKTLKTISGKRERPEALHRIQFRLEQVAESNDGWVFISDKTGEKAELKVNKNEIIIDIAQGNQLARWFNKMKDEYGVQIIKRLSNNSDSWLITFNKKKHEPDTFLKYLQADPVIKSASFKIESPSK